MVLAGGLPAKGSTKAALRKKECLRECGDVYKPVCAGDGTGKNNKSFGSECVLSNHNCEHDTSKSRFVNVNGRFYWFVLLATAARERLEGGGRTDELVGAAAFGIRRIKDLFVFN